MLKRSPLKHYFELRQRLIDNKDFLVQITSAKTEKSREGLLQSAASEQLNLLRDLLKNLRQFLKSSSKLLPYIIKTILKDGR